MTEIQFLAGAMVEFFLFTTVSRPVLGTTYPMDTSDTYPVGKAPTA